MKNYWNSDDDTRLTRWLYSITAILFIGPASLSGITESLHRAPLWPMWLNYLCQCTALFCWGLASLLVVITHHRREPHTSFYTQPRLWFGLIGFTLIPDDAILGLHNSVNHHDKWRNFHHDCCHLLRVCFVNR